MPDRDTFFEWVNQRTRFLEARLWRQVDTAYWRKAAFTYEALSFEQGARLLYKPVKTGEPWGRFFQVGWFQTTIVLPPACQGRTVFLEPGTGLEGIIALNGVIHCGVSHARDKVHLPEIGKAGKKYEILYEAYAGHGRLYCGPEPLRADGKRDWDEDHDLQHVHPLLIHVRNDAVWELLHDLWILVDAQRVLPEDSMRRHRIREGLMHAVALLEVDDPDDAVVEAGARQCRKALKELMASKNGPTIPRATGVGHAHLDVAWLWPLDESKRKVGRTFSNQLWLMDLYPHHHFLQSQAHLYWYCQQYYPQIWKRLKAAVKRGQWEINGGMWVEADCNVSGGESLVRQFLLAHRFWRREFGVACDTLWLPDVFGYSASLPQILQGCDIPYFATHKINWNQVNKFPLDTFWWEGIDGTTVLSHFFGKHGGYNARVTPDVLVGCWRGFPHKGTQEHFLLSFGHGDGGGGPTETHLENALRLRDFEGVPKLQTGKLSEFFGDIAHHNPPADRWVGELYLEGHRGTYTTQARNKRGNRKSEFLMRRAELAAALAWLAGKKYPQAEFEKAWRLICLNQFHDILPGSSITRVYEDSQRDYAEVEEISVSVMGASHLACAKELDTRGEGTPVIVANALSWNAEEVVEVSGLSGRVTTATGPEGESVPVQTVGQGKTRKHVFQAKKLPSLGYAVFQLGAGASAPPLPNMKVSDRLIQTSQYTIRLNRRGEITSLVDHALGNRPVQAEGAVLNEFQLFGDCPISWEAWDLDDTYQFSPVALGDAESIEVIESGPVRARIRVVRPIGNCSRVIQDIVVTAEGRRIDFETEIDWRETRRLLKLAMPVNVLCDQVACEIQYGHTYRANHENTSWQFAQWEICAQKWVDLSQGDWGVALLNDCKYGHDVRGNTMRLTVLRSPRIPDPHADMGLHRFTYSLLPHAGGIAAGRVVQQAYQLNCQPQAMVATAHAGCGKAFALATVDAPSVVVEAVKKAEDDEALIIRAYETAKSTVQATFTLGLDVKKVMACNLIERDLEPVPVKGNAFTVSFKPFQIRTFKVYLK